MKYILSDEVALRSWMLVPFAFYTKGRRNASGLTADEYRLLKRCDGLQEISDPRLLEPLIARGLCRPAAEGETLSDWQREKICSNRYFPALNWMITGRCNYNCLHCFNAADNNRLQSEFTLEEAEKLIVEAEKCGINAFTITGGEPMLHPSFMEILRSIHARGMYVEELNTNGFFLSQKILDEMGSFGCRPLIKISFDGVGCHDWLRGRKGAEEDALRAVRLCISNGFRVKIQTNVHRLNRESLLPTAELLSGMGVREMRIIRTTESPRWRQNAKDACLTPAEYFDTAIRFSEAYARTDNRMDIDIWQLMHLWKQKQKYTFRTVECLDGEYCDSLPVCRGNRGMAAIGANGNLYPCHQMSGYYEQHNWLLGNVKRDGLLPLLRDSKYLDTVCATLKDLKEHNPECASCRWFRYCCGGCRAIGLALTEDVFGSDQLRCLFYKHGYAEKIRQALPGWENLTPFQ